MTGTGTGVGKTTVSATILRARIGSRGYKPVETGGDEDGRALAAASGADAGPTLVLRAPLAPNVAARLEGATVDPAALLAEARRRATQTDLLVVETPGGLFSPMTDSSSNADWLTELAPDRVILVATNRLGVLHDVEACRRACPLPIDLVVLTGPSGDPTNRTEVARRLTVVTMPAPDAAEELREALARVL